MKADRIVLVTGGSGFIGTRLVTVLTERGCDVVNLDIKPPLDRTQRGSWVEGDVLQGEALRRLVDEHRPHHVVHLAARTDTEGTSLEDYRVNTEGTGNLLRAVEASDSVSRLLITSTQFVHGPGPLPEHDTDFEPHTVYGESKAISERLTRDAALDAIWTIVRPTNVWGPWHPRYPTEFWEVLRRGLYVHPGGAPVIRSYGYVGNVVHQMVEILEAPTELVDGKVLYVGDEPITLRDWVEGFSIAIRGKGVRTVPAPMLRALAGVGDLIRLLGIGFPIFSSRYRSMTESYPTPMQPTLNLFGDPPYSLEEGIAETVQWLREQGFFEGEFSR